jgi:hypothetical protein|tara:strand:+ start:297 stop:740 length:444 start_codon:yes stop_codon:yes gene_type:complete
MDPITLCTSAFSAIKSGVEVGKQLTDLSHQIIKFVGGMSRVEEQHKKKKSSWFTSSNEEALDTFFSLQKVHQMEEQLREVFMLYGNINMWNEFVAIRAKIRKERRRKKEREALERAETIKLISYGAIVVGILIIIVIFYLNFKMLNN